VPRVFRVGLAAQDADASDRLRFRLTLLKGGKLAVTFDQTQDAQGWDKADYAAGEAASFAVPAAQAPEPGDYGLTAEAYDGVVWGPATGPSALRLAVPGDMDGDATITAADAEALVDAFSGGASAYRDLADLYPQIGTAPTIVPVPDGVVDARDLAAFVWLWRAARAGI
jgi:hypothetical protein